MKINIIDEKLEIYSIDLMIEVIFGSNLITQTSISETMPFGGPFETHNIYMVYNPSTVLQEFIDEYPDNVLFEHIYTTQTFPSLHIRGIDVLFAFKLKFENS